ncbi:protein Hikeshi-like isoform X3 [Asterias rubens]|uniref:protein Hikeshi-like isoform X3 n=1 Tax=Asterias rubens TaxID=7604 RepID=UPI001455BFBE|nr:protein Hikeshi-like isoform X3 [Asterias rubens]
MQQIDDTHVLFNIFNAATINHIVVFLTGTGAFPEGMGRAIYFSWPSPEGEMVWMFLGFITNEKPSAIFKVVGLKKGSSTNNSFMQSMPVQQPMKTMSQIGISVEPLHVIQHQIPAESTQTLTLTSSSEFSMKMLENFYNYASSFGINQSQMTPQPNISWIPMTVLDKWFQNFKKKMAQDQNFWRK